ncbi:MAG: hypothetical protein IPJ12_09455 [Betaproteobacteria bacterium]|nr:hypothetical protein [Betaproteobacteria bacterium]
MVIFLSYAAEHLEMADQAKLALAGAAYRAFFERGSLLAGANYHVRIRELKRAGSNSMKIVFLSSLFL